MQSKDKIKSGLTVLCEDIPYVKSVSLGLLLKTGSRHEAIDSGGISHMLEHMMFKGTDNLSAQDLAEAFDMLGAYVDAFTGREYTCFFFKMVSDKLPRVMELLSQMMLNPAFSPAELEKEKNVILEEIKMYMDQPDDVAINLFIDGFFSGHPLGRPILGSMESVRSFSKGAVSGFFGANYLPGNALLCAAGEVNRDELLSLVEKYFGGWSGTPVDREMKGPTHDLTFIEKYKKIEQAHVIIGGEGLKFTDKRAYELALLNDILGGSVSSRLFQEVREKRGLAYSIQSFSESYSDTGLFAVYAGTDPAKRDELVEVVLLELEKIKKEGPTDKELIKAKEQAKSGLVLSMESTSNRMTRMLRQELYFGRFIELKETMVSIEKVDKQSLKRLAGELFREGRVKKVLYGPDIRP